MGVWVNESESQACATEALEAVALLEGVCHWGPALRFQKLMPVPVSSLCLFPRCCLSMGALSSSSSTMPACCHANNHDGYGLYPLGTVSYQIKCFLS